MEGDPNQSINTEREYISNIFDGEIKVSKADATNEKLDTLKEIYETDVLQSKTEVKFQLNVTEETPKPKGSSDAEGDEEHTTPCLQKAVKKSAPDTQNWYVLTLTPR
jgi:hypothetical protein